MTTTLLLSVFAGIAVLLILVLYFRIQAFLSLLIASIIVGLLAGLNGIEVIQTIQKGMAGTLGFVATVVGLGAILGSILEHSGGTNAIVNFMIRKFGVERAPSALAISGFVIAIPVFFDVAFIILVPVIYALQRQTRKSLLLYAIPLLAGLATTHAFIPPTPGPVAVADIIGAQLGWVILIGFIAGIPTVIVSGILFGKYISKRIHIEAPKLESTKDEKLKLPHVGLVISIIAIPIIMILVNTTFKANLYLAENYEGLAALFEFLGHPFAALIIANLLAWYLLGIRKGYTKKQLLDISTKSLAPAGVIILLTGAGGVFKQVLVDTGAGKVIAELMANLGMPIIIFAFIAAAIIRVIQGSATVAMITAAGLVSPLLSESSFSGPELGCIVISIASGATILSHVNDSGFWLVNQYLGLTEKQTFKSLTVMTTILALTGFTMALLLNFFF
ncbi:MAG: GntP family permease [Bacteroidia bacterium]|nr:GntP family permease [Bacteroidia bacterium]NND09837.1 gluconate transporter [Flavobacteriaceae bacterium]MBT8309916.1 GntP family permease [Bacteroidia bacterium]NNK27069.1 gluconate transporter [Flavobacteriaceae bacterium]NNL59968.1 gluconate transporter [Flavobacteriaceae bacterium]